MTIVRSSLHNVSPVVYKDLLNRPHKCFTKFGGAYAFVFLEHSGQMALVREFKFVGNFINAHIRIQQAYLNQSYLILGNVFL